MSIQRVMNMGNVFNFIFLFFVHISTAQTWIPDFKHFTTRDGLASSEVYQITSDQQKNIWFATDRGAVKFDGYSFRTYDTKDSLPDNSVIKLYKDVRGRIWFISYKCLLSYWENGRIVPYKYNNFLASRLQNTIIISLFVDSTENVHLNTIEGKEYFINASGKCTVYEKNIPNSLFVINSTNGSSVITNYYQGKRSNPTTLNIETLNDTLTITVNEAIIYSHFATIKLKNNDLIFYCERYLVRIKPSGKYEIKKLNTPILNIFEDGDNSLWIGTTDDGVYVYDDSMKLLSHYLQDVSVSHIYKDFEGGYWFSSLENGVFYLLSKNNSCFAINEKPLREKISAISNLSDSVLFFTSSKAEMFKYNCITNYLAKEDLKKSISPHLEYINSIYVNKPDSQLVLGATVNFVKSAQSYSTKIMNHKITVLPSLIKVSPQSTGNILGSVYANVYSFNLAEQIFYTIHDSLFKSTCLFENSQEKLYSGNLGGLYVLKNREFIPVEDSSGLLTLRVTDIKELNNKYLVIATRSNGVIIYDGNIVKNIDLDDGLSSANINCIAIEDSIIWAGTNKGLCSITITNQNPFGFYIERFDISNGIISDEINDFALGKNIVYTATNQGLNRIQKKQPAGANIALPLYITSITINEKDTIIAPSYSLNDQQNFIGISFTGLSFRSSKSIIYKYRLLGVDSIWRSTTNRDVQFSGLNSGNYTFQLLAALENIILQQPIEIKFTIAPAFYETTWFRLLTASFCILILISIINFRIRFIQKKADEKNVLNKKFSDLNLNALRSQMNPHFTFNVLNSIKYYIAKKDSESAQLYISKFSRLIRMFLNQSRSEFITLHDEIKMLTLYMELEELRFENKFTYAINVDDRLNTEEIDIPGMLIQPFVENSIKHGIRLKTGEARVEVAFTLVDSILVCTITDNGIGREQAGLRKSDDNEYKSMGTAIVADRIEALGILYKGKLKNYTIDLKDENGNAAGTCVKLEIPYKIMA
jgi:ligand-binding sensor domain-containing protein